MRDPKSVAFEIKYPWKHKPTKWWPEGYRATFITVWHVDPQRDGTDDSCGRFVRARHGDPKVLKSIEDDMAFSWDASHGGWFDPSGKPIFCTIGVTYQMFQTAAWVHFKHNRRKTNRFLSRHLTDIINFAENTVDSLHDGITGKYGFEERGERIRSFSRSVYGCILRWTRPWWRDPIFHVHHWELQIHPLQAFKRWAFTRCCKCGRRFRWGESGVGGWAEDPCRWFRGEKNLTCSDCERLRVAENSCRPEPVAN
jgi:hypothetical protein